MTRRTVARRKIAIPVAVMAATVIGATAAPAAHSASPGGSGPAASPAVGGYVHAPGGAFFTDDTGRRLLFHGVNLVPKCGAHTSPADAPGSPCIPDPSASEPPYILLPGATDPGRRFTTADAQTLHDLGFNVVRLGIIWAALEPGPAGAHADDPTYCAPHTPGTPFPGLGAEDPYNQATVNAYLQQVDTTVGLLAHQGIRVLIDMHQDDYSAVFSNPGGSPPWEGEGAPAWATCTNGVPFTRPSSWDQGYEDPAVESAFDHFWSNDVSGNLQGQYIRTYAAVARHLRANADVMGYELFNEPIDPTAIAPPEFDRKLTCFYAGRTYAPASCTATAPPSQAPGVGAAPAVLQADPNHLVFYEPPVSFNDGVPETTGLLERLPFDRLVFAFHDYGAAAQSPSGNCTSPACGPQESAVLDEAAQSRAATGTSQPGGPAWMLTEFGAEAYAPDIDRVAAYADDHLLSWAYWSGLQLHDPTGTTTEALIDDQTRQPDPQRAAVLARVYADAVAGLPTGQSFNPQTERYTLTYTADPGIQAPTEIVVPTAWHYAGGYHACVSGGSVVSAPGADRLLVRNSAGGDTVGVTVVPQSMPC